MLYWTLNRDIYIVWHASTRTDSLLYITWLLCSSIGFSSCKLDGFWTEAWIQQCQLQPIDTWLIIDLCLILRWPFDHSLHPALLSTVHAKGQGASSVFANQFIHYSNPSFLKSAIGPCYDAYRRPQGAQHCSTQPEIQKFKVLTRLESNRERSFPGLDCAIAVVQRWISHHLFMITKTQAVQRTISYLWVGLRRWWRTRRRRRWFL